MGVISTYGELKAAVLAYAKRSNTSFSNNVPGFVRRAHDTLMRELRIPLLMASTDLTINAERVSAPSDFRAVARLFIDGDVDNQVTPATVEQRMLVAITEDAGRPRLVAKEGALLAFAPAPDATYTGKLLYYRAIPFFSIDGDTNDLLDRYPFAYLYGALAEGYGFDKFDEDQAKYEALFRAEIDQINAAEARDAMAGGLLTPAPGGVVV